MFIWFLFSVGRPFSFIPAHVDDRILFPRTIEKFVCRSESHCAFSPVRSLNRDNRRRSVDAAQVAELEISSLVMMNRAIGMVLLAMSS